MAAGVDTSALYYYVTNPATLGPEEKRAHHAATAAIDRAYEANQTLLVPFTAVIELANIIHHRNGRKAAETVLEALLVDSRNKVVNAGDECFAEALLLSKRLGVKYTDCIIYLTLKKAGATSVITADNEFKKFGDITTP